MKKLSVVCLIFALLLPAFADHEKKKTASRNPARFSKKFSISRTISRKICSTKPSASWCFHRSKKEPSV